MVTFEIQYRIFFDLDLMKAQMNSGANESATGPSPKHTKWSLRLVTVAVCVSSERILEF